MAVTSMLFIQPQPLCLLDAQPDDQARYTCVARNIFGEHRKYTIVTVTGLGECYVLGCHHFQKYLSSTRCTMYSEPRVGKHPLVAANN